MNDVIQWPADGLIPAVIQSDDTDDVLMVGFMNREALARTRHTGLVHFFSRSRQTLWQKGESSGHVQHVRDIRVNCERNSLLVRVSQVGAVCHDGYDTCFYRRLTSSGDLEFVRSRLFDPRDVYGDGLGLAGLTRCWWGAYEFLRDVVRADESSTAQRLQGSASVSARIRDELQELAGVLDGTHVHQNQHDDALLEGSQCSYWLAVEAIRCRFTWEDVRPDRALDVASSEDHMVISRLLRSTHVPDGLSAHDVHALFAHVGNAVAAIDLEPRLLIERDLHDLRSRPYLAPYFAP